ncbi:unnamed protein product, partial [marine sediment metagenome]
NQGRDNEGGSVNSRTLRHGISLLRFVCVSRSRDVMLRSRGLIEPTVKGGG